MKHIKLSQGKQALVDDEDFEWLSKWQWTYANTGYAKRQSKGKTYLMHREILKTYRGFEIDHKNRNRLDNRRSNLRRCKKFNNHGNTVLNSRNTSGYKGVSLNKSDGKWKAQINYNKRGYRLGTFLTKEEAAVAYNKAAKRLFRKFARINDL